MDLTNPQRAVLAQVARREIARDYYGRLWTHVTGGTVETDLDARNVVSELEEAGLIACPDRVGGQRSDRYFDLTPAALEA